MNGHIKEHSAADCRIFCRRGSGVSRCDFDDVYIADFTVGYHLSDMGKVMVKAAVKSNLELNSCLFNRFDNCVYLFGSEVNGLFAENVLACRSGFDCYVCMSIR